MHFDPTIPIIGLNRTWKSVGLLPWQPVDPLSQGPGGKIVQEVYPHGLILTGISAMRSDDEPVQIMVPVDARLLQDPRQLGFVLAKAFQELATYLQCGCSRARGACLQHAPVPQRREPEPGEIRAGGSTVLSVVN
jgi:hypothetical protein